jgi:DNA-binding CsgD family transcriptional regulator
MVLPKNRSFATSIFGLTKSGSSTSNLTNPPSTWARKRAAGKARRANLIERREAYFDLLVSGYSVEEIAAAMNMSPSAVRRAVGQAVAKRRLDAPEAYARLQVARLTKALRCADVSLENRDLNAIAPFVQVVRELNRYHGLDFGRLRLAPPAALPPIAPGSEPRLQLAHSAGAVDAASVEDGKSCAREVASP